MAPTVLVIGGTGPTGIPIVQNLVDRGWDVTILTVVRTERAETPAVVKHLHHDPYDAMISGVRARRSHLRRDRRHVRTAPPHRRAREGPLRTLRRAASPRCVAG